MKINHDHRVSVDPLQKDTKSASNQQVKFGQLVRKHDQKLQMDQLNKLLATIEDAGSRLAKSRTFKDLAKYKTLVKKFVKEAVHFGMDLKQSHTWNQFGEGRKLNIVETIDGELVELTDMVMDKEKKSIDVLGKIGEIKGLLINLYM
ncbi:YaaR family protein [Rossellomorea aquimaris]|uniref:YaaR family protein n=1 Tax=Rossellomorea aquimaris TaxID=189382 RepID=UPI001CD4742D|nr:YaaR family protein [Rossellomorea aquimaris]MCA1057240.1 YaaR family protein [Rossellomorea aquimaris]